MHAPKVLPQGMPGPLLGMWEVPPWVARWMTGGRILEAGRHGLGPPLTPGPHPFWTPQDAPYKRQGRMPFGVQHGMFLTTEEKIRR